MAKDELSDEAMFAHARFASASSDAVGLAALFHTLRDLALAEGERRGREAEREACLKDFPRNAHEEKLLAEMTKKALSEIREREAKPDDE